MQMRERADADWLVSRVIAPSGLILPMDPFSIGMFEVTRRLDPFPRCDDALKQSAAAFGEVVDLSQAFLIKAFFLNSQDQATAIHSATLYAREALVLFRAAMPMPITLGLMRSGYCVNLKTLNVFPLAPSRRERISRNFGVVGMLDEVEHHPAGVLNRLLSVHPKHFGELGAALRRSTHWSSLAEQLEDQGERFLVQWMACETLTRVDENESLTPKLMSALGLPTGRYFLQLPASEREALKDSAEYKTWRPVLNELFDRLRDARNQIAHTGFREVELVSSLGDKHFDLAKRVLPMLIGRLHGLALAGLELNKKTISDLWDSYARCKLQYRASPLADEVKGTIVYSLTRPDPLDE